MNLLSFNPSVDSSCAETIPLLPHSHRGPFRHSILESPLIPPAHRTSILDRIGNLFQDSDTWPAGRSLYYLGILPSFSPHSLHCHQIHTRLAHECHTVSIRLAAEIWAAARCESYSKSHPPSRSRPSLVLPSLLAHILPPSPSYPSFSISFT